MPDALAREVKRRKLSPSALLQGAVVAEVERREQMARLDAYLRDLQDEVGVPTRAETARANALARRLRTRVARRAG